VEGAVAHTAPRPTRSDRSMLLVESPADLLLGVLVAFVLALEFDLAARLVRPLGLLRCFIGRLDDGLVADPVLRVVHVATELVLFVVDLLAALSRLILVRVLVHVPLSRRAAP